MRNLPSLLARSAQSSSLASAALPLPPLPKERERRNREKNHQRIPPSKYNAQPASVIISIGRVPPLLLIPLLWLLIQLPAGTSSGLCSKSKEPLGCRSSDAAAGTSHPAKFFSHVSDKVALIDGAASINQMAPGGGALLPDVFAVMQSGGEGRTVVRPAAIPFSRSLHSSPSFCFWAIERLNETELHALLNREQSLDVGSLRGDGTEQDTSTQRRQGGGHV